jgi:hypothetical protein
MATQQAAFVDKIAGNSNGIFYRYILSFIQN